LTRDILVPLPSPLFVAHESQSTMFNVRERDGEREIEVGERSRKKQREGKGKRGIGEKRRGGRRKERDMERREANTPFNAKSIRFQLGLSRNHEEFTSSILTEGTEGRTKVSYVQQSMKEKMSILTFKGIYFHEVTILGVFDYSLKKSMLIILI
jgi:hypothetical protein